MFLQDSHLQRDRLKLFNLSAFAGDCFLPQKGDHFVFSSEATIRNRLDRPFELKMAVDSGEAIHM